MKSSTNVRRMRCECKRRNPREPLAPFPWVGRATHEKKLKFNNFVNFLDRVRVKDNKHIGFEFKYTDAPRITKSMTIAQKDLRLDHLAIIYPGDQSFPLAENIVVYGLERIAHGDFLNYFPKELR
jgi:hypothetical protein